MDEAVPPPSMTSQAGGTSQPPPLAPSDADLAEMDRQRVLDELRDKEQRLRLLIEGVKDYAIFMLDPDGRVASWNPTAERIKGYTAGEVLGRHFSIFYPPE